MIWPLASLSRTNHPESGSSASLSSCGSAAAGRVRSLGCGPRRLRAPPPADGLAMGRSLRSEATAACCMYICQQKRRRGCFCTTRQVHGFLIVVQCQTIKHVPQSPATEQRGIKRDDFATLSVYSFPQMNE